ncbi:hypothetical protein JCM10207_001386 [Rhodosporidiobolus poonsookiae]
MDGPTSPNLSINTRYSGFSLDLPVSACDGGLSLPGTPLLSHFGDYPTDDLGSPHGRSRQSIPIFFRAADLELSQGSGLGDGNNEEDCENGPLSPLESDASSSASSSRRLSIDSSSGASNSTAPTAPPSPLSPTTSFKPSSPVYTSTELSAPLPHREVHTYPPPPLLNARRRVSSRPGTAGSRHDAQVAVSQACTSTSGYTPPQGPTHRPPSAAALPPSDAFFPPSHAPPSTGSSTSTRFIPIRLVPPTPTSPDRALRGASFRQPTPPNSLSPPRNPPVRSPLSPPSSPPRAIPVNRISKPLPCLPVFPTHSSSPEASPRQARRTRTPPEHANEGVYNVPLFPPCVYPPSAPSSTGSSRLLRSTKSTPLLGGFRAKPKGYSQIVPVPPLPRAATSGGDFTRPRPAPSTASSVSSTRSTSPFFPTATANANASTSSLSSFFLPVPGETTLELTFDQEGFRQAVVEFEYMGLDEQSGMLEWVARMPKTGHEREGWPFHVGFLQTPPYLRRVILAADPSRDYLSREACLPIAHRGEVYKVSSASAPAFALPGSGSVSAGGGAAAPYYCLAYEVLERLNLLGERMKGERLLKPLVFVCSRDFLHPSRGRKIGMLELVSKALSLPSTATLIRPSTASGVSGGAGGKTKRPATRG